MALKKYNVTVNGFETVLQLDERGAKARGLTDRDLFKPASKRAADAKAAADKQAADAKAAAEAQAAADKKAADEKAAADKPAAAPKAAAAPANKSRTADNKQ